MHLTVFGFGRGLHPFQSFLVGPGHQREVGLQCFQVCRSCDHSRRGTAQHLRQLAGRHLIQIHIVQPQCLAIGDDALLKRFEIDKLETVGPRKFKAAAGGLGFGHLAIARRAGDHLRKDSTSAFGVLDKSFQAFQATGRCQLGAGSYGKRSNCHCHEGPAAGVKTRQGSGQKQGRASGHGIFRGIPVGSQFGRTQAASIGCLWNVSPR